MCKDHQGLYLFSPGPGYLLKNNEKYSLLLIFLLTILHMFVPLYVGHMACHVHQALEPVFWKLGKS